MTESEFRDQQANVLMRQAQHAKRYPADTDEITIEQLAGGPWDTLDAVISHLRDFFAAIGVVATLAFIVGYLWMGSV